MYMLNAQALDLVVLEKIFSHCKLMADTDTPGAWSLWNPGARFAGFMKGITKHCYIQNIEALGLVVSEKNIFHVSPTISLWQIFTPPGHHKI